MLGGRNSSPTYEALAVEDSMKLSLFRPRTKPKIMCCVVFTSCLARGYAGSQRREKNKIKTSST
jgi:hypothetical protein